MRSRRPSDRSVAGGWTLADILRDVAVAWQLLRDPAVPGLLKLTVPAAGLLYWLSPIDLLTGMPFDDLAVLVLAARLFVQMAPREAVERALRRVYGMPANRPDPEIWDIWNRPSQGGARGQTIDGQWRVVDESSE